MPAALELLGRRWALRLVWELRRDALAVLRAARADRASAPRCSATRLARARRRPASSSRTPARRYRLTGDGRELARLLYELNRWAERGGRGYPRSVSAPELSVVCRELRLGGQPVRDRVPLLRRPPPQAGAEARAPRRRAAAARVAPAPAQAPRARRARRRLADRRASRRSAPYAVDRRHPRPRRSLVLVQRAARPAGLRARRDRRAGRTTSGGATWPRPSSTPTSATCSCVALGIAIFGSARRAARSAPSRPWS